MLTKFRLEPLRMRGPPDPGESPQKIQKRSLVTRLENTCVSSVERLSPISSDMWILFTVTWSHMSVRTVANNLLRSGTSRATFRLSTRNCFNTFAMKETATGSLGVYSIWRSMGEKTTRRSSWSVESWTVERSSCPGVVLKIMWGAIEGWCTVAVSRHVRRSFIQGMVLVGTGGSITRQSKLQECKLSCHVTTCGIVVFLLCMYCGIVVFMLCMYFVMLWVGEAYKAGCKD